MGRRILIVEDSQWVAGTVADNLRQAGYEVFVKNNGFEALRDLEEIKPDLMITDINMPKLDGLKLCYGIKQRLETKDIPFILLSSQFDEDTVNKCKELGACHFISKPFEMDKVRECITQVLEED